MKKLLAITALLCLTTTIFARNSSGLSSSETKAIVFGVTAVVAIFIYLFSSSSRGYRHHPA
jgi:hypothetical protein